MTEPSWSELVRPQAIYHARKAKGFVIGKRLLAAGTRLYREIPDHLIKLKSKKEQAEPQWDLLASSPEDMIELGEKLRRSKKKADQNLANLVRQPMCCLLPRPKHCLLNASLLGLAGKSMCQLGCTVSKPVQQHHLSRWMIQGA